VSVGSKLLRTLIRASVIVPEPRRKALARRLRGRRELREIAVADGVVVSYGKSGRTWLRVMLTRYYQARHGLERDPYMEWEELRRAAATIPNLFFTHDNYVEDVSAGRNAAFQGKRVVLLARHPADTAVSMFHQWKHRMKPIKRWLNDYPADTEGVPLFEFVASPRWGIPRVVRFLNGWAGSLSDLGSVLLIRYEDMRADTAGALARILRFLGSDPDPVAVREAVEFASLENMRKVEKEAAEMPWVNARLRPRDRDNPDSFKVRRGKVGGYRADFTAAELARIDGLLAELDPVFGYGVKEQAEPARQPISG
jgi:hypothetical protein